MALVLPCDEDGLQLDEILEYVMSANDEMSANDVLPLPDNDPQLTDMLVPVQGESQVLDIQE